MSRLAFASAGFAVLVSATIAAFALGGVSAQFLDVARICALTGALGLLFYAALTRRKGSAK